MNMQAQKSPSRRRSRRAVALPNGVARNAAHNSQIEQMASSVARSRAAERHAMTAEAAYYRAQKRGFEAGHELEDWLAAEEEVARAQMLSLMSPPSLPSGSVS